MLHISAHTCDGGKQRPEQSPATAYGPPQASHQGLGTDAEAGPSHRHDRVEMENYQGIVSRRSVQELCVIDCFGTGGLAVIVLKRKGIPEHILH